ncbi:hypothetical protein DPEC_G00084720 [Dallia pectoralis]|uniref:Uncharacterized protein n=1 Tax=Dallia pectoralis TaxID=75939 RepID=A0ACC2GZB5_DALPE|nr:hypothetical protein DPEC_G00084720 [Dallia pectoralis]
MVEANAFRALGALRSLDLQKNKLGQIPRGLPPRLEMLRLGHNRITGLQESVFEDLRKLRLLDLQNNQITNLRSNTLSALVQLECLHLDGNKIETVQGALRLSQLNLLSMGNNKISSFPSAFFTPLQSLVTLRLPGNLLSRVPHDLPHALSYLNLDRNQIRALRNRELGQLRKLTFLSVSFNRLVSVDGGLHLPNLTVLELPGNHLRVLPSRLSPKLERLDCRQNSIHEVTFQHLSGMRQLKHLFLENNTIQKFEANALRNSVQFINLALEQNVLSSIPDGLPESLVRLDLKGNHIVAILEHELRSLKHLQLLNLRRNKLSSLPRITEDLLPRLRTLYLDGNPWNCSCELLGVQRTLLARRVEIPNELCTESASVSGDGWRAYWMAQHRCEEYFKKIAPEYQVEQTDIAEYYDYDS